MKKKTEVRFSVILSGFLIFLLTAVTLFYNHHSFQQTKKILEQELFITFQNQSTIASIIMEQETTRIELLIDKWSKDKEINHALAMAKNGPSKEYKNYLYQARSAEDPEIFFILDKNEKLFINASSPLFYKEGMIQALQPHRFHFSSQSRVIHMEESDIDCVLLLVTQKIIHPNSGKVIGYIFGGSILNQNTEVLNKVSRKTHVKNIDLIIKNHLIATTRQKRINKSEIETIQKQRISGTLSYQQSLITAAFPLVISGVPSDVHIVFTIEGKSIKKLENSERKRLAYVSLVFLLTFIGIISLLKIMTDHVLSKLVTYSEQLAKDEDPASLEHSLITEINSINQIIQKMTGKILNKQSDLESAHQQFLSVLQSLDAIIYVVDYQSKQLLFTNSRYDKYAKNLPKAILFFDLPNPSEWSPAESYKEKRIRIQDKKNKMNNRWYHITERSIRWSDQNLVHLTMAIDITERKIAEKQLLSTKKYLNCLLDSLPSILITVNEQLKITHWNLAAEHNYNQETKMIIGKELTSMNILAPRYLKEVQNVIRQQYQKDFFKMQLSDSPAKFYNLSIFPVSFSSTKGAIIRIDDITEQEQKEEQLVQAQKMETVGNLAGGLAHDFNNILGGILGTVSLLKQRILMKDCPPEALSQSIGLIEQASIRAANMVKQLLSLSRKHQLSLQQIDLNHSIKNVLKICENSMDKSISISLELASTPALIQADPNQIEQIILNLSINAAHAMTIMRKEDEKIGGTLTITLRAFRATPHFKLVHSNLQNNLFWQICISDTGVGIPATIKEKIFDPFFSTKSKSAGTGLGLSMVYNLVDQHHGLIEIDTTVGKGTSFSLYFPKNETEAPEKMPVDQTNQMVKGTGTILIIDDEEIILDTAKSILKICGYTVYTASSGKAGIEIYLRKYPQIDMLIMDMAMPIMSGYETYLKCREINPDIKVLIASGYRQDGRVDKTLKAGANGFIQKPYTILQLSQAVHDILNK